MKYLTIFLLSILVSSCMVIGDNSANVKGQLSKRSIKQIKNLDSCLFQIGYAKNSFIIYEEKLEKFIDINFSAAPSKVDYKFKIICNAPTKTATYYEKQVYIGKNSLGVELGVIELVEPPS